MMICNKCKGIISESCELPGEDECRCWSYTKKQLSDCLRTLAKMKTKETIDRAVSYYDRSTKNIDTCTPCPMFPCPNDTLPEDCTNRLINYAIEHPTEGGTK